METEKNSWKIELVDALIEGIIDKDNTDIKIRVGSSYERNAPRYLYKYYSDKSCGFKSVKNCKLWFSAPCNYNDVFDCEISVDEKGIFESICNSIPDKHGVRTGSPMWYKLRDVSKSSVKKLRSELTAIRNTLGIACFSEVDDSVLMWSHYANNHAGICVEYDIKGIVEELKFSPVPVLYSNERVVIDSLDIKSLDSLAKERFIHCIVTKSRDWSYEKEWRIIRDQGACGDKWDTTQKGALLDMIRPHSLILGCMAKEDLEEQAKVYCSDFKINLYKMEKSEDTYSLIKKSIIEYDAD